jgi:hypothetical protein
MKNFELHNISTKTIDIYIDCFNKNGSHKTNEKLSWQLLELPIKSKYVNIAVDKESNRTAGTYAVFPVVFKIGNQNFTGSQAIDAITDENFRGKGLFINLAKNVYEMAVKDDVKLVFGFPNGNSVHGHKNKLSWTIMDPVPFLLKPLNTQYFSKKFKFLTWFPNISISRKFKLDQSISFKCENSFSDEVNDIWIKFSKEIKVAVIRSKEYLEWRYLKKPQENYQIVHAYTKEGIYIGFVIYCIKEKHGGKVAYIMEYIFDPEFKAKACNLLKYASNEIIKEKADCILSWCFEHSENYSHYKSSGFYNLPEKLRPIELHFGTRAFDKSLENIITNRNNWYLSYSDSDTV